MQLYTLVKAALNIWMPHTGAVRPPMMILLPLVMMVTLLQFVPPVEAAFTVTVKQHVFVLLQPSVAWKQTWLIPTGKAAPEASPLVRIVFIEPVVQVVVGAGTL
jgi:hypothetical protein